MWDNGKYSRPLLSYMELKFFLWRIKPILYRRISILSEACAESLLYSLTMRLKTILYLHIGMSISPGTAAMLLHRCPCLINLVLHGGGNSLCEFNMILNALNNLMYLRYLSLNPALFFQTPFVHLPDTSAFHHVTHLDLTTQWVLDTIATGAQHLNCLTHLSMTWKMSHRATHGLLALLQHQSFKLLLLWLDETGGQPMVIRNLHKHRLDNSQIVLLCWASNWSMELSGGFWLHAEHIIAWCEENNSKYGQLCSQDDTNLHCSYYCGAPYDVREHHFCLH